MIAAYIFLWILFFFLSAIVGAIAEYFGSFNWIRIVSYGGMTLAGLYIVLSLILG